MRFREKITPKRCLEIIPNQSQAGFSLIEMAIVLIIIGIVAGAAMPSVIRYQQLSQIKETRAKQEIILQAMAGYVLAYGNLPCPADPSVPAAQRGEARGRCGATEQSIGIIPYRTLALPESDTKDAFHRYMTYVVPAVQSNDGTDNGERGARDSMKFCRHTASNSPIILLDQHNQPQHRNVDSHDYTAVVLISHGPNGHGAFTSDGSRFQSGNPGREERVNSDLTSTFYSMPFSLNDNNPFRHIVKGVTRNNLMSIYGHSPCSHDDHSELRRQPIRSPPAQGQRNVTNNDAIIYPDLDEYD